MNPALSDDERAPASIAVRFTPAVDSRAAKRHRDAGLALVLAARPCQPVYSA
jgi:hypothetical protein